mgnify:CR=1 FL=1
MKSLVVDDEHANRILLKKVLGKYGSCDLGEDGLEAVTLFLRSLDRSEPYDLICLDVSMPKMDGLTALRIISHLKQELLSHDEALPKIVMTTSHDEQRAVKRAYELGCEGYVVKPINFVSFRRSLETMGLISKE